VGKGITPVVGTVLLLTVTVAAAGTFMTVLNDVSEKGKASAEQAQFSLTEGTLEKQSCYRNGEGANLVVSNTGEKAINTSKLDVLEAGVPTDKYNISPEIVEKGNSFTVTVEKVVARSDDIKLVGGGGSQTFLCSDTTYPESCDTIKKSGNSRGDGYYFLDSDGPGGDPGYKAYCKMKPSGGWTLIASYVDGSFFNSCSDLTQHGSSCHAGCSEFTDDGNACDEVSEKLTQDSELESIRTKYVVSGEKGTLSDFRAKDYVSPAYSLLSFEESKFVCRFDDQRGWWGHKKLGGDENQYSLYLTWYVK